MFFSNCLGERGTVEDDRVCFKLPIIRMPLHFYALLTMDDGVPFDMLVRRSFSLVRRKLWSSLVE